MIIRLIASGFAVLLALPAQGQRFPMSAENKQLAQFSVAATEVYFSVCPDVKENEALVQSYWLGVEILKYAYQVSQNDALALVKDEIEIATTEYRKQNTVSRI